MGKSNLKINIENVKRGRKEEEIFKRCIGKFKGFECVKSNVEDDRYKHIDFYISNGMTVDVKAHKKINSTDKNPSDDFVWVELLNVNGNIGWLDGWATHIAYSFTTHYKLFDREKLRDYLKSKLDLFNYKIKPSHNIIPYQIYRRSTLKDKVVLVPVKDLMDNVPYYTLYRDENLLDNGK